jgi:hypothetical protein
MAWDDSGHIIAHGRYRIQDENRAATVSELWPSTVSTYPGHPELAWIELSNGHGVIRSKTLVPVNSAGQRLERFEVHTIEK